MRDETSQKGSRDLPVVRPARDTGQLAAASQPKFITAFTGEYRFLSNFSPSPFRMAITPCRHEQFPTVEHAYHYLKVPDGVPGYAKWWERIQQAKTPAFAKTLGRKCPCRADWDEVKIPIMHDLLWRKFVPGSTFAGLLLRTGDAVLVEGNSWGDRFWGESPLGYGDNHLGNLLMQVRADLQAGRDGIHDHASRR